MTRRDSSADPLVDGVDQDLKRADSREADPHAWPVFDGGSSVGLGPTSASISASTRRA
jgi:hypothetical protein